MTHSAQQQSSQNYHRFIDTAQNLISEKVKVKVWTLVIAPLT